LSDNHVRGIGCQVSVVFHAGEDDLFIVPAAVPSNARDAPDGALSPIATHYKS
jgi:hypothetical protein